MKKILSLILLSGIVFSGYSVDLSKNTNQLSIKKNIVSAGTSTTYKAGAYKAKRYSYLGNYYSQGGTYGSSLTVYQNCMYTVSINSCGDPICYGNDSSGQKIAFDVSSLIDRGVLVRVY